MRTTKLAVLLAIALSSSSAIAQAPPGKAPATKPGKPAGKPDPNAPPPAPEPPPPPPAPPGLSETLTGDAKADYDSGKVLFGDGDHAGALIKFKSAYDKAKDARLLWNVAACEKNLRHYSKALRLVKQYLKEGDTVLTDADRAEANELIKVMEPLTAKLKITVNEAGAEVTVDDEPAGTSPVDPVVVDIGTRKVRVKKAEFEEFTKEVPVGGAAELSLEVALVKIAHEGRLTVRASSDAAISVDGKLVGTGTWTGVLPSGGHTLQVSAPKMVTFQSEVYLQDKETRDVPVTLQPEPSKGLPAWAWIAGGVVVAGGLGVGGYFLFKGSGTYEGPAGNLDPGVVQAGHGIRFR